MGGFLLFLTVLLFPLCATAKAKAARGKGLGGLCLKIKRYF